MLGIQRCTKQSILGYHGDETATFLRIFMALPNYVSTARGLLQRGFTIPGFPTKYYQVYEVRHGAAGREGAREAGRLHALSRDPLTNPTGRHPSPSPAGLLLHRLLPRL